VGWNVFRGFIDLRQRRSTGESGDYGGNCIFTKAFECPFRMASPPPQQDTAMVFRVDRKGGLLCEGAAVRDEPIGGSAFVPPCPQSCRENLPLQPSDIGWRVASEGRGQILHQSVHYRKLEGGLCSARGGKMVQSSFPAVDSC